MSNFDLGILEGANHGLVLISGRLRQMAEKEDISREPLLDLARAIATFAETSQEAVNRLETREVTLKVRGYLHHQYPSIFP